MKAKHQTNPVVRKAYEDYGARKDIIKPSPPKGLLPVPDDLDIKTLSELRNLASYYGVPYFCKLNRLQLIQALNEK